jgi:hypothetical protein
MSTSSIEQQIEERIEQEPSFIVTSNNGKKSIYGGTVLQHQKQNGKARTNNKSEFINPFTNRPEIPLDIEAVPPQIMTRNGIII